MIKTAIYAFMASVLVPLMATTAEAQIVTSYYAPQVVAPSTSLAYTPGAVLTPTFVSPVIGTIPVRRGLFGLSTEHVPVLAAAPFVPSAPGVTTVARPVVTTYSLPYSAYSLPYTAGRPVIGSAPILVAPAPTYPFNAGPYNSFYPGAVMTMQ
jgi:hypothetical protein